MKGILTVVMSLLVAVSSHAEVTVGAARTDQWLRMVHGKRVAILANHTSVVGDRHIVDIMVSSGVDLRGIVAPEHGFRGGADAGEKVASSVDERTGVEIWSLYSSKSRSLTMEQMSRFDVMVVDIQDVGLRFYTYYITMLSVMKSCAECGKRVIILDRPNPNGMYTDGPILREQYFSGVGRLPIPIVHGMTLGEMARMAIGEGWCPDCDLQVVTCLGYTHSTRYVLPVPPSPNLKSQHAVYLYPSVCLFEGTVCSLGRGTSSPFEMYGHPDMKGCTFSFTPRSVDGAKNPPLRDACCHGVDLRSVPDEAVVSDGFTLKYIIDAYEMMGRPENFFTPFFEKLVGVSYVRKMIMDGYSEEQIRAMWKDEVDAFVRLRARYLLYD